MTPVRIMDGAAPEPTIYLNSQLLGKTVVRYTCADLRRLLQEWFVQWTGSDDKIDLARRVHKYVRKHPKIDTKERIRILKKRLDKQPFRYQVYNEDGELEMHSYHLKLQDMFDRATDRVRENAIARTQKEMLVSGKRGCLSCRKFKTKECFPRGITTCCNEASDHCSSCLTEHIRNKSADAKYRKEVTCMMCDKALHEHDVKVLSDRGTFDM